MVKNTTKEKKILQFIANNTGVSHVIYVTLEQTHYNQFYIENGAKE